MAFTLTVSGTSMRLKPALVLSMKSGTDMVLNRAGCDDPLREENSGPVIPASILSYFIQVEAIGRGERSGFQGYCRFGWPSESAMGASL